MTILGRDDVERIVENVLQELSIEIKDGDYFSGANNRTIILNYKDREISRSWFSVKQQDEYDG